jgi:hypothetical protein
MKVRQLFITDKRSNTVKYKIVILIIFFAIVIAGTFFSVSEVDAFIEWGCIKAVCYDSCKNLGNEDNCVGTNECVYGDFGRYGPVPEGTDHWACNQKYIATSAAPAKAIYNCSPSPSASRIRCSEMILEDTQRLCSGWKACFCKPDIFGNDVCKIHNIGDHFDSNDCEP